MSYQNLYTRLDLANEADDAAALAAANAVIKTTIPYRADNPKFIGWDEFYTTYGAETCKAGQDLLTALIAGMPDGSLPHFQLDRFAASMEKSSVSICKPVVRAEIAAIGEQLSATPGVTGFVDQLLAMGETRTSIARQELGRDAVALDITKARIAGASYINYSNEQAGLNNQLNTLETAYGNKVYEIENWDGGGDAPAVYGA